MMTYTNLRRLTVLLIFFLCSTGFTNVPPSSLSNESLSAGQSFFVPSTPELVDFASSLTNNQPDQLVGVYVDNIMALPVVNQPENDPSFVSNVRETLTNFALPIKFGVTGLLAHNNLAGSHFYKLASNDIIILVYGDGTLKYFQIDSIKKYRALTPRSPYSSFINVDSPDSTLTSSELFRQIYSQEGRLVLQTCISSDEAESWGRLFVLAHPVETTNIKHPLSIEPFRSQISLIRYLVY